MELPDFLEFGPFNLLRQKMGANALGDFVFFDPQRHLTGQELLQLKSDGGIEISVAALRVHEDFTLIYKNARVLVALSEPESQASTASKLYHLADCSQVALWRNRLAHLPLRVATREMSGAVCTECLQRLRYEGFDRGRSRHQPYNERVREGFDLQLYYQRYPCYPVAESESVVF